MEARFATSHSSILTWHKTCLRAAVSLWICFSLMGSVWAGSGSKARTALVIGNAKYEKAVGPLRNTSNDAKAVAKTLRSLGFSVIERQDVTRDQLLKAVLEFRPTLAEAEVALFYFAGHGISVSGANYLIPLKSTFKAEGADDVTLRMLAETRLINVEQIVGDMANAGAKCNLMILDACRTTTLARTGRTRDAISQGGLAEMTPPAGSLIAFATDAGQTALDGDGTNGLYTDELLKHMRTPGLTIEQVFKRTRAGVLERSKGGQIPAEYSRLIGEDIFLAGQYPIAQFVEAPPGKDSPAPQPVRSPAAAPTKAPSLTIMAKWAQDGKAEECLNGLQQYAQAQGPGDYAAVPMSLLLDRVKEDLKDVTTASPAVVAAASTCESILKMLPECLPQNHPLNPQLTARAHNRHGDALILLGRVDEAVENFDAAQLLMPEDFYILYNRGRAHRMLGNVDAAKADLKVVSEQTKQPKVRKLAIQALAEMP